LPPKKRLFKVKELDPSSMSSPDQLVYGHWHYHGPQSQTSSVKGTILEVRVEGPSFS